MTQRELNTVELGDKDGGNTLIQRRTIQIKGVTGRYDEAGDRLRRPVGLHLLHDARQHGLRTRGRVSEDQLILEDGDQSPNTQPTQARYRTEHHQTEEEDRAVHQNDQLR